MSWYAFFHTITANAFMGPKTGQISDKFKLKATPRDETFRIWSVIYYGLATFLWSANMNADTISLFDKSMQYNRDWLDAFVAEDMEKSLDIIRQLRTVNNDLAKMVDNHYVTMYASWIRVATILNESIVQVHIKGEQDQSVSRLYEFVKGSVQGEKPPLAAQLTYQWALQGIDGKDFAENEQIMLDEMKVIANVPTCKMVLQNLLS